MCLDKVCNALGYCKPSQDLIDCSNNLSSISTQLINCKNTIQLKNAEIGILNSNITELTSKYNTCENEKDGLENENITLKDRLDKLTKPSPLDLEFPMTKLLYERKRFVEDTYGNKVPLTYDVREFCYGDDYYMQYLHDEIYAIYRPQNEEDTVKAIMAHVAQRVVKYETDSYQHQGWDDFWQFPEETWALGKGDCEDGSILIASIMRTFIESSRIRLILGTYAVTYGHCWIEYHDGIEWKILESTWPFKLTDQFMSKKQHGEYKAYYAFNDRYTWVIDDSMSFGQTLLALTARESREFQHSIALQR